MRRQLLDALARGERCSDQSWRTFLKCLRFAVTLSSSTYSSAALGVVLDLGVDRSKLGIMWWTILAVVLALVCVVCVLAALVWPGRFGPSD